MASRTERLHSSLSRTWKTPKPSMGIFRPLCKAADGFRGDGVGLIITSSRPPTTTTTPSPPPVRTGQNSTKNGIRERPSFGGLFFLPLTKRTPAGRYLQTSGKAVYVVSIAALTPFQTYSCMPFQATALEGECLPAMPLVSDGSAPWPKPYKPQGVLPDPPVKGWKERGKRAAQGANSRIFPKFITFLR